MGLPARRVAGSFQWDPERDVALRALPYRTIQIGLGAPVLPAYVQEWIVAIEDATDRMRQMSALIAAGDEDGASRLLPAEAPYPVEPRSAERLGMMRPAKP